MADTAALVRVTHFASSRKISTVIDAASVLPSTLTRTHTCLSSPGGAAAMAAGSHKAGKINDKSCGSTVSLKTLPPSVRGTQLFRVIVFHSRWSPSTSEDSVFQFGHVPNHLIG